MPASWLKPATVAARNMGRRYLRWKSGSECDMPSTWMESTISFEFSVGTVWQPRRAMTYAPSGIRFLSTSQRALRGMANNITKNSTAGRAATPSCQRHSFMPNRTTTRHSSMRYATKMPMTMLIWNDPDQQPAPACRSNLSDVHRAENGRAADRQASNEAEGQQRRPAPGEGASEGGDDVASCENSQRFAPAHLVAQFAGEHGANHRADQRDRDGDPELADH